MKFEEEFSRFMKKVDYVKIDKLLLEAYVKGYTARLKEEETLRKNPVVRMMGRDWFKYNYGATAAADRDLGQFMYGELLSWDEANKIPFCKLPQKEQFEELLEKGEKVIKFNVGLEKERTWNNRMVLSLEGEEITFSYGAGLKNGRPIWEPSCGMFWLADEVDEDKALAVVFEYDIPKKERKVDNYTTPVKSVTYHEFDKSIKMHAHFLQDNYLNREKEFLPLAEDVLESLNL